MRMAPSGAFLLLGLSLYIGLGAASSGYPDPYLNCTISEEDAKVSMIISFVFSGLIVKRKKVCIKFLFSYTKAY